MVRHTVWDCCGVTTMALAQSGRAYVPTGFMVDLPWPPQIVSAVVRFNITIAIILQSGAVADRTCSLDASESPALLYCHEMNNQEVRGA